MAVTKKRRKTVDTWKKKEWYTIYSPKSLESKEIGTTVADEEKKLIGRIIKIPLRLITNNASHQFIKMSCRVNEIKGKNAYTELVGFEMVREYLRRNIRRRRSMVKAILKLKTKDNINIKVTACTFTYRKVNTSQKDRIRQIMKQVLENATEANNLENFIKKSTFGEIPTDILKATKVIAPIKRVEIAKCFVLK